MNNTRDVFRNGKAFIPFVTAGDPSLAITEKLVLAMAEAGADLIELGLPFSDPVAEGVVIQRASERALAVGTTTDGIFDMVRRVRGQSSVPLAIMTYINPVFTYGAERFMAQCRRHGITALIVPDLPFEEKGELLGVCDKSSVDLISLIAPTSHERIQEIARDARGFVYCVSSMGVTGVRSKISTDVEGMVQSVKQAQDIPCAVGFGISTPSQARKMAGISDGVIVGSAIVRLVEEYGTDCVSWVHEYVCCMKDALRGL